MLDKKVKCIIESYKVARERVEYKITLAKERVDKIIDKAIEYVNKSEHGNRLKNNIIRVVRGIGIVLLAIGNQLPVNVLADTGGITEVSGKIRVIFNPIVEMLASLGYPTAYVMLIIGGLMVMTGRKSKGLEIIKWASIGYIALQLVPFFLSVLELIGIALRGSL